MAVRCLKIPIFRHSKASLPRPLPACSPLLIARCVRWRRPTAAAWHPLLGGSLTRVMGDKSEPFYLARSASDWSFPPRACVPTRPLAGPKGTGRGAARYARCAGYGRVSEAGVSTARLKLRRALGTHASPQLGGHWGRTNGAQRWAQTPAHKRLLCPRQAQKSHPGEGGFV